MLNKSKVANIKIVSIFTIVIVLVITSIFVVYNIKSYGFIYYKSVKNISENNNLDPNLIMAMIKTESSFYDQAVSQKGAVGFMQLLPTTAEWICTLNDIEYNYNMLFNYKYNVDLGCKYFNYLLSKFSLEWAIVAYNSGENKVREWIKNGITFEQIPYKESREYLKKVLANFDYYNAFFT